MPITTVETITCDGTDCAENLTGRNPAVIKIHGGIRESIKIEEDKLFLCDECFKNRNFVFKCEDLTEE